MGGIELPPIKAGQPDKGGRCSPSRGKSGAIAACARPFFRQIDQAVLTRCQAATFRYSQTMEMFLVMMKKSFALLLLGFAVACSRQELDTAVGPVEEDPVDTSDADAEAAAAEAARRAELERCEREGARERERVRSALAEMVFFDYDEAVLRPDANETLRPKVDLLRDHSGLRIRVEGHADERGTSEYNIALGNERADAVIQYMTAFGLDAGRFSAVSYGEEQPLRMGSNESAWSQNRRAEFVITAGEIETRPCP